MAQLAVPMPRPRPEAAGGTAPAQADNAFGTWLHKIFQPQNPPADTPQTSLPNQ
jgi:hypothetical protein